MRDSILQFWRGAAHSKVRSDVAYALPGYLDMVEIPNREIVRNTVDGIVKDHVREIYKNPDARLGLRYSLSAAVMMLGRTGAIIMRPSPETDETGLRDDRWITGCFLSRLREVFAKTDVFDFSGSPAQRSKLSDEGMWNTAIIAYNRYWVVANALNYARIKLEGETDPDWFRPFVRAMYIAEEASIREKLGMSVPLKTQHEMTTMAWLHYSTFCNLVTRGEPNPLEFWETDSADSKPDLSLRDAK